MSKSAKARIIFWSTPALCAVAGIGFLLAGWHSGHPGRGAGALAIMLVFGAVLVLVSRRSETVRGLLDRRDERITRIDLVATAATGLAVTLAIIAGAIVELARGHSGAPYTWLAVVAAVAYVGAVLVQRVRG
jgi:hypothetical protein